MRDPSKPERMTLEEEAAFEEARLTPAWRRRGDELREQYGVTGVRLIDGWIVFVRPCAEAVAETWERVLRARLPGTDWHVIQRSGGRDERTQREATQTARAGIR